MSATCGNVICARREHLVAVLIKCASDLAAEVDSLKACAKLPQDESDRIQSIVERTYDACEQLGEKIGEQQRGYPLYDDLLPLGDGRVARRMMEEKKPCQHVFVVADECVKCGAPEEETHL